MVGILYSVAHNCVIFTDTEVVFLCLCTTLPYREMGILWHMEKRPSGMVIFKINDYIVNGCYGSF